MQPKYTTQYAEPHPSKVESGVVDGYKSAGLIDAVAGLLIEPKFPNANRKKRKREHAEHSNFGQNVHQAIAAHE